MALSVAKSPAVTTQGPFLLSLIQRGPRVWLLRRTRLRLRMMSVTSSETPGSAQNSWAAPWMRMEVMAAPSMEESRTRRRLLPSVRAYPISKGSAMKRA